MVSISAGLILALLKDARAVGGQSMIMCLSIIRNEWNLPDGKNALPLPSKSTSTIGWWKRFHSKTPSHLTFIYSVPVGGFVW